MYKQLTFMPALNGSVMTNKAALQDPAVLAFLTDLHERNYKDIRHPLGIRSGYWNISDYD